MAWQQETVDAVIHQFTERGGRRHHLLVAPAWHAAALCPSSTCIREIESRMLRDENGVFYGSPPTAGASSAPPAYPPYHPTHTQQLIDRLVYECGFVYLTWFEF